jgi:hypothetical protein
MPRALLLRLCPRAGNNEVPLSTCQMRLLNTCQIRLLRSCFSQISNRHKRRRNQSKSCTLLLNVFFFSF